jgi:3-phenylpropionate/cinnamic acid dioxygenase small subunit
VQTADPATFARDAVEAFLYQEARFADENLYDEWLALWDADVRYWIPVNIDVYDPDEHVSIIYDNRERLQDRIARLKSGGAWAQEPQSRMRRVISNVEILPGAQPGECRVLSNFVLGELRRGRETAYFAQQEHRLRQTPGGLRMTEKIVRLVRNNEPLHNLSFLL